MTRYVIVDPRIRKAFAVDVETIQEAKRIAEIGNVDHGQLARGLGYCVYEYAMFEPPPDKQAYCSINGHLIPGPAVLYGYDEAGETIDLRLSEIPTIRWYLGINDVEAAIERGEIVRPYVAVNDEVLWEWPAPQ
jgi:hypothetical protein